MLNKNNYENEVLFDTQSDRQLKLGSQEVEQVSNLKPVQSSQTKDKVRQHQFEFENPLVNYTQRKEQIGEIQFDEEDSNKAPSSSDDEDYDDEVAVISAGDDFGHRDFAADINYGDPNFDLFDALKTPSR